MKRFSIQIHSLLPGLTAIWLCLSVTGCQTPGLLGDNLEYRTNRSPAQIEADHAYVERMEDTARRHRHEDDMAAAEATEVATRHNPTSVSTSQTNIVPIFW